MNTAIPTPAPHLTLDHIAHFLPDIDAASAALMRLGFTLTPFSAQSHRLEPGGPLVPAGTGNRCIMLQNGYVEILTPTLDTNNAAQLRSAIARYTGVHLIAFGTQAPAADYARLETEGFSPLPPVALQRQVSTESSADATARFTVVRVPPTAMAEGRIQYCQHHTPDVVWQSRWTRHPNHATGLAGVLVCVADPPEAAHRYSRFTGLPARQCGETWQIETQRGQLFFSSPMALQKWLGITVPTQPWIAGYIIDSDNMAATRAAVGGQMIGERACVHLPAALGGVMIFQPGGLKPLEIV